MSKREEKKPKKAAAEVTHHKRKKAAKISLLAILVVIALFLLLAGGYSISYSKKILANVSMGEVNLGGKSKAQVSELIKSRSEDFLRNKIALKYLPDGQEAKDFQIEPSDIGLVFDNEQTASLAFSYGRDGNILENFGVQLLSLLKPHHIVAVYAINQDALDKKISEIAAETDTPEKDYEITYAGDGKFNLLSERQTGKRIDRLALAQNIQRQIEIIKSHEYQFATQAYEPQVTETNAEKALKSANKILAAGPLELRYSELSFSLDTDTIAGLIKGRPRGSELELYADNARVATQVDGIAQGVNRPAKNAVLAASGNTVSAFQLSQEGRELDKDKTIISIGNALLARTSDGVTGVDTKQIALSIKATQPDVSSDTLDKYGLKELVATGTTDFRKSPPNRVHNITVGANAINGTLLKPGEEFSTLGKLGAIDASTGYLPELVIKNNKTLPDYGGGLCQVSTTLFRAALNAGMKITSRYNHSYRVSYYEPPIGMDATIFDPAPDFKFINNYSSYILVQSRIEGTKITFDFYGTKDSRAVSVGTPTGYDYVEPPAPVYTVDPTLPPGTENLVSHSHQGASAKFHYEVIRDGAILQSTDFTSKYVALPEMWTVSSDSPKAQPTAPPAE